MLAANTLFAASAAASVIVLGNSAGRSCYEAARDQNGSATALKTCDEALEVGNLTERDRVATFVNRGIVKIYREDHRAAMVDFDQAIAIDPNEPESYLNKGSAVLRMGASPDQAIPLFDEAISRQTRRPELAFFGRGIAHELSGKVTAAYNDYKRASELAPRWEQPKSELSRFSVRRASSTN
jgi:tetratricopeptide (TPR) repeat protein